MSIAVYAGTFDPITAGHYSVIREGVRLFSHLVVMLAINPAKKPLFTVEERVQMIRHEVRRHPNVLVDSTEGLIVEHARLIGATVLVRGIRGATDAEFETDLARMNREIAPEISTIFLPAAAKLSTVSSSGLKQLVRRGEDVSAYCSPEVADALRRRIAELDAGKAGGT